MLVMSVLRFAGVVASGNAGQQNCVSEHGPVRAISVGRTECRHRPGAGVVPEEEVLEHSHTTPGCVFLHQDAREGLEHRRDPIRSRPFICQQFSVRKKWVEDLTSIRLSCSFLPRIPPYIEKGRVYQKVPKTPLTPIDSVYTARLCRLRMRGPCLAFSAD